MAEVERPAHFLQNLIREDLDSGRVSQVVTRFPPEPNGYLHVGHAKSICLNFGLAEEFAGQCNLRFDDTNPEKESSEFVESIKRDVEWLGFSWAGQPKFTSDYFDQLYDWAVVLVSKGLAYVCELSADEAREYRGTLTEPGKNSPWRDRSVDENTALLERMKAGDMPEGSATLRAKIDMAHGNINMRDPVLYRIRHVHHHNTGDRWKIYPSYDYAHGQADAIEGITHSICTLEFQDHRPLYEWLILHLPVPATPHQYEFARLNLNYTVTSKRKLKQLVDSGFVDGWDDPRMPTIAGMRRRGYTARALRNFCDMIGVTKADSVVDVSMLEYSLRDDLDKNSPRAMAVLDPLPVVLTNYAQGHSEKFQAALHPNKPEMGTREIKFSGELFIERDDFREEANKKYKRLVLGKRVRLRNAYVIEAERVEKGADGEITRVYAKLIEDTFGCDPEDGIKPKGVSHWVEAKSAAPCEVHVFPDRLFTAENPGAGGEDFMQQIASDSSFVYTNALVEPALCDAAQGVTWQFERQGYFTRDSATPSALRFNRTIGLRDTQGKSDS